MRGGVHHRIAVHTDTALGAVVEAHIMNLVLVIDDHVVRGDQDLVVGARRKLGQRVFLVEGAAQEMVVLLRLGRAIEAT